MLSRKKSEPAVEEPAAPERPGAKNRPTPKRKEREAANRRPLVPDTKSASADQKARAREQRARAREGMMRGEDRYLTERDKGPVKRYLRDLVDSRWNIGEFLLPLMLVILAMSVIQQPWAQLGVFGLAYGLIVLGIGDAWLLGRRAKRRVQEEFGQEAPRGTAWYVAMRSFQMRMSRVPRPQVKRGDPVTRRH